MMKRTNLISTESLEPLIFTIRGERIMLDADLARLYAVTTGRLNEAVKRNFARFPTDFAFQLTRSDFENLISQFAISSSGGLHGGRRKLPWAFTEHGALMAANILRSERAVEMSVFVIRAFVKLHEQTAANAAILKRLAEIDRTLLSHDGALKDLYRRLLPPLSPVPLPPRRQIGFRREE